jgi:hypothetical protein
VNAGTNSATYSPATINNNDQVTVVMASSLGCATGSPATSPAVIMNVSSMPAATITAGGATTFCAGGSVALNANIGAGFVYQWKNGGVTIASATSASYTASVAGNYTVDVVNGACSKTSSSTTVIVNPYPSATATAVGSTTFCSGGNVTLNANTGAGLTYQWKNGGSILSGATNSSYAAVASGNYSVDVTGTGCTSGSSAVSVTVNSLPSAAITAGGSTTFCSGGSVVLNANTGAGLTYQWIDGVTPIAAATNVSYTAASSGNYKVTVTDANACSSTSAVSGVVVNANPIASVTAAGPTTFCSGSNVMLNANTGAGLSYQWNNGAAISGATNASYSATAAGSYTVVVTNSNSCSATSSVTSVSVNANPAATITAGSATTFCAGDSVNLSANTGAGFTYQWTNGVTAISGATGAGLMTKSSGSYTVTVTDANTCSTISSGITVTANTLPVASISPVSSASICAGDSLKLIANTGTGLSYIWNKNGIAIPGSNASSYYASSAGNYTVVITDGNICTNTSAALALNVNPLPVVNITAGGPLTFCSGGSVVLSATVGAGLTYQWKQTSGTLVGETNSTYTATSSSVYSVTVTNANLCSDQSSVGVTVMPLPTTANAGTDQNICTTTATLAGNTAASGIGTWTLVSGSGSITSVNSETSGITGLATGANVFKWTISTASCGSSSDDVTFTFSTSAPASVTISPDNNPICSGTLVTFNAVAINGGASPSYQWKVNGANAGTSSSTFASSSFSDNDQVEVVLTSSLGCATGSPASSAITTMNVNPTPTPANAGPDLNITTSTAIMAGNVAAAGSGTWSLFTGTGTIGSAGNPSTSVSGLGAGANIFVWTISSGLCAASTDTVEINMGSAPAVAITGSGSVAANQAAVIYTATNNSGVTYVWTVPSDANIVSGQGTNSITVDFGITDGNIAVTETNIFGSASASLPVTINGVTGVRNGNKTDEVVLYPNPFYKATTLRINSATSIEADIRIVDVNGLTVSTYSGLINNSDITIGESLSSGVYFAHITTANGVKVVKLIKVE